jgi:hypothetical protein
MKEWSLGQAKARYRLGLQRITVAPKSTKEKGTWQNR